MRAFGSLVVLSAACCAFTAESSGQSTPRSPEVERLQFFVGRWSENGEMREDANQPFKAISGGEACSWAAGGYAVVCEESISGPGGGWEGVYILSYDATSKQYHVYGTEKPGSNIHAVGQIEGERWVWIADPFPDGSRLRYVFSPNGAAARTMKVEVGTNDKWSSIVNVQYTRRK